MLLLLLVALHAGDMLLFREGRAKGVGRVRSVACPNHPTTAGTATGGAGTGGTGAGSGAAATTAIASGSGAGAMHTE